MKNRFLLSGVPAAFLGLFFLFFSVLTYAGDADTKKSGGKSRWERIRANQHTGTVNPGDVFSARQQLGDLTKSASSFNLNWVSMGPDNFAGITWSLLYDNRDASGNTIYAGSITGGVWRSTNNALTWNQVVFPDNLVPKTSAMVQLSNGTIYAGTGLSFCGEDVHVGTGLYRSTDGINFSVIPSTRFDVNWASVSKLVVSPVNQRIFAATTGGLQYSDNGDDWTIAMGGQCTDVSVGPDGTILAAFTDKGYLAPGGDMGAFVEITTGAPGALPNTNVGWIVFATAPSDAQVMYASLADLEGMMLNIYRSIDRGATWSVIFPSNPTYEPFNGSGCYANTITVFPDNAFSILLGGQDMWWGQQVQPTGYYDWQQLSYGQAPLYFKRFIPTMHHSYVFRPNSNKELAIASDGGVTTGMVTPVSSQITFQTSNRNYEVSQFNSVAMTYAKNWVLGGADIIGSQMIGYYYPTYVNSPRAGFPVWIVTGTFDDGGDGGNCEWSAIEPNIAIFTKQNYAPILKRQDLRDPAYVNDFLMGITNTIVDIIPIEMWESFNFQDTRDSVKYIADVDIPAGSQITALSANIEFPFTYTTPVAIPQGDSIMVPDPIASRFFIYGTRTGVTGVFMTKDAIKFTIDPSYFMIHKDLTSNPLDDPYSTMSVSKDLNTLWVGTEKGRLIRISNLILAHDSATADLNSPTCIVSNDVFANLPFATQFVSSIAINPNEPNHLIVTVGNYGNQNYVYMTENALDSLPVFTPVQGNLPQIPVLSSLIEMHDANRALVGTDLGCFSTSNLLSGSPVWVPELLNIGDVPVTEIRQQTINDFHIENLGAIYISTYGRGLWMDTTYFTPVGIDPVQGNNATEKGTLLITPNPVRDIANVTYTTTATGNLNLMVTDLTGRVVMSGSLGSKPAGTHTSRLDLSPLNGGTYLVRIGNAHGKIVKL
jgi:hypothetical protein